MKPYRIRSMALMAAVLFASSYAGTAQDPRSAINKKPYQNNGTEGTITGTISLKGKAPRPLFIDMSADPVCVAMGELKTEWWVVTDGKIANAIVYLRSGSTLKEYSFPEPEAPAELAHKGCRYEPHTLGMRVGQTLMVSNNDPTVHNTRVTPKYNPDMNMSQPPDSPPLLLIFSLPEPFVPFRSTQHPWEQATVGVFAHPFFAVSDKHGNYTIAGVPPGVYTLVVAHERYGEKTLELTVSPHETRIADFTLDVADSLIKQR